MRDAYFSALYSQLAADANKFVITDDFGAYWLSHIARDFPRQYLNSGICEQNMITIAAGMALQGRRVYVVGQNNFIILRAFEQINIDICQMKLPVTLVGVGAGYTYSTDGATHHGVTDMGAAMQLPLEIFNASDSALSSWLGKYESDNPVYIRLQKGELPDITRPNDNFKDGARILRGGDRTIITSGFMVGECLKTDAGVIDIYRVHPLSHHVWNVYSENPLVVEDNLNAPLHKAVSAIIGECESLCPKDFLHEYGSREFLHRKAGIDVDSINRALKG